jgi:ArsR family transcriptional regulator
MKKCDGMEPWEICLFRRHAEFCLVFSNPVRLRLLFLLGEGERAVTEMAEAVETPLPTVSQHLRVMRDLGCLQTRRAGRTVRLPRRLLLDRSARSELFDRLRFGPRPYQGNRPERHCSGQPSPVQWLDQQLEPGAAGQSEVQREHPPEG